jgi:integrase
MENTSRKPDTIRNAALYVGDVPTFAELIAAIQADHTLPKWRRDNVASSLRCLARALGKRTEEIHAFAPNLRRLLKDVHPIHLGISRKRWQNIRADFVFALTYARCRSGEAPRDPPLSSGWESLLGSLKLCHRIDMSRFARWCSAQGIDPDEVDDQTLASYDEALACGTLTKQPRCNVYRVVRTWNRVRLVIPTWPQRELHNPYGVERFVLPETELSPSFLQDLDRYCRHLAGANILAAGGIDKPLRPASIESARYYARYLHAALVRSGSDPRGLAGLADLIKPAALRLALEYCLDRAGKITVHIGKLADFARQIGKYWVKSSDEELAEIRSMTRKLILKQDGMTPRNRLRLQQMVDPVNLRALLEFPLREMKAAIDQDDGSRRVALMAQMAVAVEILLMAPIRRANLATLEVDRSYIRNRRDGSRQAYLMLEPSEVKNSVPLKFDLPEQTVELIDVYFHRYHRRLFGSNPCLFPGRKGSSKGSSILSDQISKRLFDVLGLRIHVHLFRHLAAKIYLDRHPAAFEFVRQLLGHKSIETTMRFYAEFNRSAAARRYDEVVLGLRDEMGQGGLR